MTGRLALQNPSSYPRRGFVSTPWEPLRKAGFAADSLQLFDRHGSRLNAQVDQIEPDDPARAVLVFELDRDIGPGPDDYSQISDYVMLAGGSEPAAAGPSLVHSAEGFKLINEHLNVWFNLMPNAEGGSGWSAGAASSVQLDGVEILDNFIALNSYLGHDPEKRLQIDRIRLRRPAWDDEEHQDETLFDKTYEVVSRSEGPVRASVTLASQPFDHAYLEPVGRQAQCLRCRFHRVISLYRGADSLTEELYLKGLPADVPPGATATAVPLAFIARYFLYMNLGLMPEISQFRQVPDWFALGCDWAPHQGYAFATDVHAGPVANPHPGFSGPAEGRDRSFSWELGAAKSAKCVHRFQRRRPRELADEAGRAWYHHVYKPLRAVLAAEETR